MMKLIGGAFALQLIVLTSAWACDGQVGAPIFQDDFSDTSGGWDQVAPESLVKPPVYEFAIDANCDSCASQNITFNATDGDYCMDAVLPKAPAANNQIYVGIEFWATDYNNSMLALLASNGQMELLRETAGNWQTIFTVPNAKGFNAAVGAVNTIRATALAGKITVYLNGALVQAVRAQEPTNTSLKFGMFAETDTAIANAPVIQIKSFSVTAGQ